MERTLSRRVVQFLRALREAGLPATVGRTSEVVRALELLPIEERGSFRSALRALCTTSVEQYPTFDRLFDRFFGDTADGGAERAAPPPPPPTAPTAARRYVSASAPLLGLSARGEARLPGGERTAGTADLVTRRDLERHAGRSLVEGRRRVRRLAGYLATAPSRRLEPSPSGPFVDVRRSIRAAERTGGELARILRHRRKERRLRVVALCDVSGSMERYAEPLLQLLSGLQQERGEVRTYLFSTRLMDVTGLLRRKEAVAGLRALARAANRWGGGTAIGASLAEFNRGQGRRIAGRKTVVLILSDGWERGDVSLLEREMRELRRRAHRIVWLNPLAAYPGYEPTAKGMAAALPYVDLFLPFDSLESLERVRGLLRRLR